MNEETNPFLQDTNPYEGYEKSINELKSKPESVEFDKLCYLTFRTEEGKRLLELYKDRFLYPGFIHPNSPNARDGALYFEGFKEGFRMTMNSIRAHEQRIAAEVNA